MKKLVISSRGPAAEFPKGCPRALGQYQYHGEHNSATVYIKTDGLDLVTPVYLYRDAQRTWRAGEVKKGTGVCGSTEEQMVISGDLRTSLSPSPTPYSPTKLRPLCVTKVATHLEVCRVQRRATRHNMLQEVEQLEIPEGLKEEIRDELLEEGDVAETVGPSNEVLPTTHIYAALIILVLGVMLGKFFL